MSLLIENISKRFGSFQALNSVNLEIKSGSLIALIGPSGSGKSTLLRIIAGLEKPDTGKIWFYGKDASNYSIQARNVGFVFQNYALFKHMTVFENISFGLELRGVSKKEIPNRVENLLSFIQLQNLKRRYPDQLSGGQKQRIALARALAIDPKVLLLDEPFGALDARVRRELRRWLKNLHQKFSVTTILVTHDQQEAMEVADEIVVFRAGQIEQIGKPQEIYDNPTSSFVFNFLGTVNKLPILDSSFSAVDKIPSKEFNLQASSLYTRPHNLSIKSIVGSNSFRGKVQTIFFLGAFVNLDILLLDFDEKVRVILSRKKWKKLRVGFVNQTVYVYPKLN